MLPPKNPVYAGTSQRATGAEAEGRVRCGGNGAAKAAEANHQGCGDEPRTDNAGGDPGVVGAARQSVGAHDEPA